MFKKNKLDATKKFSQGLISHILLQKSDVSTSNLLLTWVEVEPGAKQQLHHHEAEQAYIIIQGEGEMTVGNEKTTVIKGDMIYVPSTELHGISNTGKSLLVYLSAATPLFDLNEFYSANKSK